MDQHTYDRCLHALKRELIPAFGCTEPIAIAYASAQARKILGCLPEEIIVRCSGNILKNAKSVVVPATGGMRGIGVAAVIGAVGGAADRGLEVLHAVSEADQNLARLLFQKGICRVELLDTTEKLHIILEMRSNENSSLIELYGDHTKIVRIEKNNSLIFRAERPVPKAQEEADDCLSFESIYEFAQAVRPEEVRELLDRQIEYNTEIAQYGLEHLCGAGIGAGLLKGHEKELRILARALPAAGSDARMSGCEMPVVVNSGSGNQGLTVSLPVIVYARELGVTQERLYRALCVSNLTAIYQKEKIGRLSAYCGAVSAGAGAGAGIAYLLHGTVKQIASVVSDTLANVAGIFCDGAKASCAAKIAASVEAALLAVDLTFQGRSFAPGEGIIQNTPDRTVRVVAEIAREGMRRTDEMILHAML